MTAEFKQCGNSCLVKVLCWYNSLRGISVQYKGYYHHLFALFIMDTVRRILMDLSFLEVEGFKKADCRQTSL